AFAGADTWATTHTLAQAIKKVGGADLVLCGKQAIDGDTAQVGPGLAERLNIPYVTCIRKVLGSGNGVISVERLMDDGYDTLEVKLPALFTVVKEINEPRLPSLKGKMKAKKLQITPLSAADIDADPDQIGLKGSPTQVVRVFSPQPRGERTIISGPVEEQVEQLVIELAKIL
ncbi:MAG TPA: electron transfer flavoprotein subunit beta/FixA family protein, partial [Desulfurivibrio alkaliphilus]|nr:electron transfer flavoprotein subunit beta/FixA family protein [Desulfurivibrio alkaliphilus]